MTTAAAILAAGRFAGWEAALFAASVSIARRLGFGRGRRPEEWLLAIVAVEVTLEASLAGLFSFLRINSGAAYWIAALAALALGYRALRQLGAAPSRLEILRYPQAAGVMAALTVPLLFLSFHPVEEADSVNYLHYLIDWMANRATPYTFATNYVAFWELSFLPTWTITRVDWFFPLLALKAIVLLALALWLVGRELGLRRAMLLWAVFGAVMLRHLWLECSGVPTLKNDALHGVGFALLALVVLRAARRRLLRADAALLAFGCAFASVKYTGIFIAVLAVALVLYLRRAWLESAAAAAFTLVTSGHYYLHNTLRYGSPFYPFQINFGPIHLPGTADLSGTSILYSLRDPQTWKFLFLPHNGVSPAGLLFPITLAGTLVVASLILVMSAIEVGQALPPVKASEARPGEPSAAHFLGRPKGLPYQCAALLLLAGWLLYFRSVFSASAFPGDLAFLRSSLNTIRYVDGVLAVSELFLLSLLARWPRIAAFLLAANLASRLWMLYSNLPTAVFPARTVVAFAVSTLLVALATAAWMRRHALLALLSGALLLLAASPVLVERNRVLWTTYWNGLKPELARVRPLGLAHVALEDGGYFAGHVVAAGNPVDPAVRSVLPEELLALPPAVRPRYLAILIPPGSHPRTPPLEQLGYTPIIKSASGGLYAIR
jgi:hypothetical protein